ncbi:hypothetical protein ACFLRU_02660 [Bacteroidota bacterium]
MKKILIYICGFLLTVSCTDTFKDAIDFKDVENPNLAEASVVGQPNSANIWLHGLERELSRTFNELIILAELGSDNYDNVKTFYSQLMDNLDIRTTDNDIRDLQNEIARVRQMAIYGLGTVGPNDSEYTSEVNAEFHFFEGMSYMLAGMYFSALPITPLGAPINSNDNLQKAITSFNEAIALNDKAEYNLAKARCYYFLGDKTNAVSSSEAALTKSTSFSREAMFDEKDEPSNSMESALFERATFNDIQPLPSLDFLDPKYSFLTTDLDPSIHYLKAEEAYLIIAEAKLKDGAIADVKTNLEDLLALIATREVRNIDDSTELRHDGARPLDETVIVNGISGLVLNRQSGNVDIPSVSGTSLTQTDIDNMTNNDAAIALLYKTRQEVFISEGIRLADMGVKFVINENEFSQNPNIEDGDPSTVKVVPSFIASIADDLDAFDYTTGGTTCTITVDLNAVLVANKASEHVLPFH